MFNFSFENCCFTTQYFKHFKGNKTGGNVKQIFERIYDIRYAKNHSNSSPIKPSFTKLHIDITRETFRYN